METLYDQDFYEWTQENARLLRERRFSEIDIDNLVEELETMGRSEKRAFVNRLAVLIAHLLKWQFQPERRSKSWLYTIKEQRRKVMDILEDSPSLKHEIQQRISRAYEDAILLAVRDTELDEETFPASCPYELDKIMDTTFFPGGSA
jgi:hypothetical protein